MELKMICYRIYGYDAALMPEDFQKLKALNIIRLYSFRMASIFNVEKTVCQQLAYGIFLSWATCWTVWA